MESNPNENNIPSNAPQGIPAVPVQPAPNENVPVPDAPAAPANTRPSAPISLWPEKKVQPPPFRMPATLTASATPSVSGTTEQRVDDPLGVSSGKPIHLSDEGPVHGSSADLIRPLRTYREDVAEAVRKQRLSAVGIVAREQDRGERAALSEPVRGSRTLIVAASVLIILAGLGAGGLAYYVQKKRAVEPTATAVPSLLFVDERTRVQTDGTTTRSFLVRLKDENDAVRLALGGIAQMYFTHGTGAAERTLSAPEFFAAIGARVSAEFIRALKDEFTVGVHVFDGNQPFIILTTDLYENAFAGMLDWEETMSEDLEPFFGPAVRSTTTSEVRIGGIFQNKILKNQDVRVLTDAAGKTALLYGFRDRRTIILTTNENTWNEVNVRLSTARLSQ